MLLLGDHWEGYGVIMAYEENDTRVSGGHDSVDTTKRNCESFLSLTPLHAWRPGRRAPTEWHVRVIYSYLVLGSLTGGRRPDLGTRSVSLRRVCPQHDQRGSACLLLPLHNPALHLRILYKLLSFPPSAPAFVPRLHLLLPHLLIIHDRLLSLPFLL